MQSEMELIELMVLRKLMEEKLDVFMEHDVA